MNQSNRPGKVTVFQLTANSYHICSNSLLETHFLIVILNILFRGIAPQSETIYLD